MRKALPLFVHFRTYRTHHRALYPWLDCGGTYRGISGSAALKMCPIQKRPQMLAIVVSDPRI
jgi:hypothetical protein